MSHHNPLNNHLAPDATMTSRSLCLRALTGALLLTSACIFAEDSLMSDDAQGLDMSMSGDQGGGADLDSPELGGPDQGPDQGLDQGPADMGAEDMECVPGPIDAAQICDTLMRDCGSLVFVDSCGDAQTISCPDKCSGDEVCSANSCVERCVPPSDDDLCNRGVLDIQCGDFVDTSCGMSRPYSCGICTGTGEQCERGQCTCTRKTDEILCAEYSLQCGEKKVTDNCGMTHTVTCGECDGEKCSDDNTCPTCEESIDQFCARNQATCGMVSGTDRCGVMRQNVMCGSCATGTSCGSQNRCICKAETDAELCAQQPAAQCGQLWRQDRCGVLRDINCGGAAQCPAGPGAPACSGANQCCYPDGERAMQRAVYVAQKRCGTLPATICGQAQGIQVDCNNTEICCNGTCMPTFQCVVNGADMGPDMSHDMGQDMPLASDLGVGLDL